MPKARTPKGRSKPKPRNPIAERLAEGRYLPRREKPKKGKGSYRRKSSRGGEAE